MKLFTGYDDDPKARALIKAKTAIHCTDDSLTVQADAKATDINLIMKNYHRTGQLPPVQRLPSYGDFDSISDFREALHVVRDAEAQFMMLPAEVRARFDNDAVKFVEFCDDDRNHLELLDMGVLDPKLEGEIRAKLQKVQEVKEQPTGGNARAASRGAAAARTGRNQPALQGGDPEGGEDH